MDTNPETERQTTQGGSRALGPGAPLEADLAGVLIKDRYRIEKVLGRGGFAVTYLATDMQLDSRRVVVKLLLGHHLDDPWVLKKFHQEMRALARLDHPGIVGAVDFGQLPDGRPFLVMQFAKGLALRQAINPMRGMDLERAGNIVRQVGNALSAAHHEGICHRDVKPENIMLHSLEDGEEQVKLIDFGIARMRDAQAASSGDSTKISGTLAYMAPEQFQGESSAASDIYALGVVAYELVTGRPPFTAENPLQLMGLQLEGVKVKPKDLRPNLPEQAQAVILKALAKKPDERFATARDFGEAFVKGLAANSHSRTVTMTETHQPRQQPAKRDKRWVWASVLVLAIAAVAWILWQKNNVSERGRYQVVEKSVSAPTRVVPETKLSPPRPDEHSKQTASRITKGASVKGATKVEVQPGLPAKPVAGAVKVNVKDGQRYRWIPAGFFQMGCSNGDIECFNNEKPVRIVTITKGFWIGETEVTQAAYEKVTGQNRSVSKSAKLPVENVSWHEAQSYCQAAGMRLPTEAEWEYAARAGSDQSRYGELGAVAWYGGNSEGRTHEVGQKAANVWGLYDTLGNVWEWMADWYVEVHPANSEADPGGPSSGEYRSTRGGNFRADARSVRVSVRRRDVPGRRSPFTGFRCVESELMPRTIVAPVAMSTPKTQVNPRDGLTYVWIPAGTFWMGCSAGDTQCAANESPRRQVTITKGFWMGQTEVTREAYQRVLGRARGDSSEYRLPVGNVTWDQAQGYCSAVGMRLPTEAEWEYAARAGSTAPRYGDLNEVAWWSGDSGGKAHEVAGKQPNANGLYDMLGNHREWVADWFDAEYYGTAPGSDPPGPGSGQARVQRGGAWPGTEDRLRASTRIWSPPRALERTNGFRCAGSAMGTTP